MSARFTIRGYQVGAQVDHTGLRTLYKGVQISTGVEVFITTMTIRPGRTQQALLKRAKLSRKLLLPQLTTAIDYGVVNEDLLYYTHLAQPSFPVKQALQVIGDREKRLYTLIDYMTQALEVVEYLHGAKTTHRDLQTSQLRVNGRDEVTVDGYVNARPRVEGRNVTQMVDLPFMSPEQLRGAPADRKTDLYGCGMILFELATGEVAYPSNYAKLEESKQGVIPMPSRWDPEIPSCLERIIMKGLAPRGSRYRHAREMMDDLQGLKRQQSIWMKLAEFRQLFAGVLSGKRV